MSCGTRAEKPARAILMVPRTSDFPLDGSLTASCGGANCTWPVGAPLPQQAAPAGQAQSHTAVTLGARARSRRLHRGIAHCVCCRRSEARRFRGSPWVMRAAWCGGQSRRLPATTLASELRPRTVLRTELRYCCLAVRLCQPWSISATGKTITTTRPNVYCGGHRFPRVSQ